MKKKLLIILLNLISIPIYAKDCNTKIKTKEWTETILKKDKISINWYTFFSTSSVPRLYKSINSYVKKSIICLDNNLISYEEIYPDGDTLSKSIAFPISEDQFKISYYVNLKNKMQLIKQEIKNSTSIYPHLIHYYKEAKIFQSDTFFKNSLFVQKRELFDKNGKIKNTAEFEFLSINGVPKLDIQELVPALSRITLFNSQGEQTMDYRENQNLDFDDVYAKTNLSKKEIKRRKNIFRNPNRIKVLIIDSGIDIRHPDLTYKIWKNADEKLNGVDDDGNGLIDDIFGTSDNSMFRQPIEDLRLPKYGLPGHGYSHGTLVADIATKTREDIALMALNEVAVNNSSNLFELGAKLVHAHNIKFTNMSFIFDMQLLENDGGQERPKNIEKFIQETPETLHIIAAGNYEMDVELRSPGDLTPVGLTNENILTVGALNTDKLSYQDMHKYKLAPFTNYGHESVDVFAPGVNICGANMGGGQICLNGTSFAAPYVLNHAVTAIYRENPNLDIYQIKSIILKTAYISNLENPLPAKSGGIVYPQRAVAVSKLLKKYPNLKIDEAVLRIRKNDPLPIKGEKTDREYLNQLQQFWKKRGIL